MDGRAARDESADAGGSISRTAVRERPRIPLVLKMFVLTALLIIVVIAVAIGITLERAGRISLATVNGAISSAAKLFKRLETDRVKELSLGASSIARDPSFQAYIQDAMNPASAASEESQGAQTDAGAVTAPAPVPPPAATPQIDLPSIQDQLRERLALVGSDVLMLADDQGILIARTDQPDLLQPIGEDLYDKQKLMKELIDAPEATDPVKGVIKSGERLYHVAIAPLAIGANNVRVGFLINALSIDENFANQIAEATKTGVLFIPRSEGGTMSANAPRSTNAPSAANLRNLSDVQKLFSTGASIPPQTVRIDQSSYVLTGETLSSAGETLGAAIFLRSLDTELAPFREIRKTLLAAGGIALLLAFLLSWIMAKRLTRPIEELADIAQSVTAGDYSVQPDRSRSDEVGILARSFASMISALRDKAELEELYQQMAARAAEREKEPAPIHPPALEEGTVLVTDLRGVPASVTGGDAGSVIALTERAMRIQESEVIRQDGKVRALSGHRLISVFGGDRGVIHAIRAARAISEELALQMGKENPMAIGVGIATGEFVTGTVSLQDENGPAMIGNAPLLALLFAWEAPTGHAYVSMETAQTAGNDILASGTKDEVHLRWLPAPLPVLSLPLQSLTSTMVKTLSGTGPSVGAAATLRLDATKPDEPLRAAKDLSAGALFANRYVIEKIIGRGGMGVVYRATDSRLDETVAIKTLPGDVMSRSPEDLERFKREIRLARKITHRNVLRTYDYGEADGVYFISMEYVPGYTLSELLEENPRLAPRTAMGISRQICRGLEIAHEQGIIHRDIKPQNVLIDPKGEVKLMDFGIARMAEAPEAMTSAGMIVGTPHYMSPEQVQGLALEARSDVYSLGVVIYEMICGQRPFDAPSLTAVLTAHIVQSPRPPIEIRPEIGDQVNSVILRCLAKNPVERYANAGELLRDLDRIQPGSSVAA